MIASYLPSLNIFLKEAGEIARFTGRFFTQWFKPRYEIAELMRQCFVIGYRSLPLVGLTAFILGLVLTIQLRPSMEDYGVASQLPAIVGIAIIRYVMIVVCNGILVLSQVNCCNRRICVVHFARDVRNILLYMHSIL